MKSAVLLLAACALFGSGSSVTAATLKGKLTLATPAEADRTVVFIESVPEGTFAPSSRVAKLSQKGAMFTPAVLPVLRGTQVDMRNDDWVSHSVFSKSEAKAFDLGLYAQDARKVVTFDKIGVVQVFCSIHARMNAVVLVLQNPFFVKPSADGSFTLEGVPAGTHRLRVYRTGVTTSAQSVTVSATGTAVVDLESGQK
jgi:plastocyanin